MAKRKRRRRRSPQKQTPGQGGGRLVGLATVALLVLMAAAIGIARAL